MSRRLTSFAGAAALSSVLLLIATPALAAPTITATDAGSDWVESTGSPVTVADDPRDVVIAGGNAYIASADGEAVTIIDVATETVEDTVDVAALVDSIDPTQSGEAFRLAASADEAYVYILVYGNGETRYVARHVVATGDTELPILVGEGTYDILVSPDGATVWGLNGTGINSYSVPNMVAGAPIAIGSLPNGFDITPDGSTILVQTYNGQGDLRFVDVATRTLDPGAVVVGAGGFDVEVAPDGSVAWATANQGDSVSVIQLPSRANVSIGSLPSAYKVAFSPDSRYAYVLLSGTTNEIVVFEAATGVELDRFPVADEAYELAVTSDRIYLPVRTGDEAQIFHALELTVSGPGEISTGTPTTSFQVSLLDDNTPQGDYSSGDFVVELLNGANAVVASATVDIDPVTGLATAELNTASLVAGEYSVRARVTDRPNLIAQASGFRVVTTLPATGIDAAGAAVAAGLLLLVGVVAAVRPRRTPDAV